MVRTFCSSACLQSCSWTYRSAPFRVAGRPRKSAHGQTDGKVRHQNYIRVELDLRRRTAVVPHSSSTRHEMSTTSSMAQLLCGSGPTTEESFNNSLCPSTLFFFKEFLITGRCHDTLAILDEFYCSCQLQTFSTKPTCKRDPSTTALQDAVRKMRLGILWLLLPKMLCSMYN